MTKYFCDRCGKEIESHDSVFIEVIDINPDFFHLCKDCYDELNRWRKGEKLVTDNNMNRTFIAVPVNTPHRHDEPKLTLNTDDIYCLVNGGAIRLYVDDEYMLLLKAEIVNYKQKEDSNK